MAQKAMTMGATIKAETTMGTMEMKNLNKWPRGMQHAVKPKSGCLHRRPDVPGRGATAKENREDGDPTLPTTCQGCKQEKGEEAPP